MRRRTKEEEAEERKGEVGEEGEAEDQEKGVRKRKGQGL